MKCHKDTWKDNSKQKAALDFSFQNQRQESRGKQTETRSFVRHRFLADGRVESMKMTEPREFGIIYVPL